MRRSASPLSLTLLGIGVFLLVLAPMLAWYVKPRAAVNPIDIDAVSVSEGMGSYFDVGEAETLDDRRITATQRVRGDVAASKESGKAVWDVVTTVDTDKSLPAADPHDALKFDQARWVTDRRTNRPAHCCEEEPYHEGEAYLKFPFGVEKRTYQWWDATLGSTVALSYAGREKVQGYEGYAFTGAVPPTKVGTRQVPGVLVGLRTAPQVLAEEWYSNRGIRLVVDQVTGRVLKARIGPRQALRAPDSAKDAVVLLDVPALTHTTATQKAAVEKAKADGAKLRALGTTVPVGAGAVGFLLAAVGAALLVRGRRPDAPEPATGTPVPQMVG
ncbi:DUF3068 domain-containing protein [Streptomyces sp. NPDC005017]|uniref:DUF3068 domain-containing protein n=1 Tax=Streptomyces sp. NPDC005017 TaxID=3364706 RepID=UPI0036B977CD